MKFNIHSWFQINKINKISDQGNIENLPKKGKEVFQKCTANIILKGKL